MLAPEIHDLAQMIRHAEQGWPPIMAGTLEQSVSFMEAFDLWQGEVFHWQTERMKRGNHK